MNSKPRTVRGLHRLGLVIGLLLGVLAGLCDYTNPVAHGDPGPYAVGAIGFLIGWLPFRVLAWIIRGFMRQPERPDTIEIIQELSRRYELSRCLKPEETPEEKERRRIEERARASWGPSNWGPLTWIFLVFWGLMLLSWCFGWNTTPNRSVLENYSTSTISHY
jgi:hypothetical protein